MQPSSDRSVYRRRFLQFLAGSPILAAAASNLGVHGFLGAAVQDQLLVSSPIMNAEFRRTMQQAGVTSIPQIHPGYLVRR